MKRWDISGDKWKHQRESNEISRTEKYNNISNLKISFSADWTLQKKGSIQNGLAAVSDSFSLLLDSNLASILNPITEGM